MAHVRARIKVNRSFVTKKRMHTFYAHTKNHNHITITLIYSPLLLLIYPLILIVIYITWSLYVSN